MPAISEGDGMLVDLGNTISIPSGITNNILIGELSAEKRKYLRIYKRKRYIYE